MSCQTSETGVNEGVEDRALSPVQRPPISEYFHFGNSVEQLPEICQRFRSKQLAFLIYPLHFTRARIRNVECAPALSEKLYFRSSKRICQFANGYVNFILFRPHKGYAIFKKKVAQIYCKGEHGEHEDAGGCVTPIGAEVFAALHGRKAWRISSAGG